MNDQTNRRKRQHIEVIGRDEGVERNGRFFDAMQLQRSIARVTDESFHK
mgnify:CR=1 FL=1